MSRQQARRLQTLERAHLRQEGCIPPEQRWWCDGCETEEARQACLSEPVTWAGMAEAWITAEDTVSDGKSA